MMGTAQTKQCFDQDGWNRYRGKQKTENSVGCRDACRIFFPFSRKKVKKSVWNMRYMV